MEKWVQVGSLAACPEGGSEPCPRVCPGSRGGGGGEWGGRSSTRRPDDQTQVVETALLLWLQDSTRREPRRCPQELSGGPLSPRRVVPRAPPVIPAACSLRGPYLPSRELEAGGRAAAPLGVLLARGAPGVSTCCGHRGDGDRDAAGASARRPRTGAARSVGRRFRAAAPRAGSPRSRPRRRSPLPARARTTPTRPCRAVTCFAVRSAVAAPVAVASSS
jgi:hypothetical protein